MELGWRAGGFNLVSLSLYSTSTDYRGYLIIWGGWKLVPKVGDENSFDQY